MKSSAIVLTALLLAALAVFPWSVGAFAAAENEVDAPVRLGWEIRPTGPASALLPAGPDLTKHPDYYAFQQAVINEILGTVPSDIRNAWPFQRVEVDAQGHLPEAEVRAFLQQQIDALNARRDALAASQGEPDPPDFSLATGSPVVVEYTYWNDTKDCQHKYLLNLGGVPWELTDSTIPATAAFYVSMEWETRIEAQ